MIDGSFFAPSFEQATKANNAITNIEILRIWHFYRYENPIRKNIA
ncbi:hypothetical protein FLA_3125 [Filimonas lacunae]|nr:hypothetical protein FLA_3125 [Filimonas lacunae]